MTRTAVIVDVVRTPSGRGKPGGALSDLHPVDLAATVLTGLLERSGLESAQIDDVLMGCVSQTGDQSMNIARQALLAAGFDEAVPGVSIDRQCGSSQQAAHFAAQGVIAGAYDIVIAAGVESMSRVPLGTAWRDATVPDGIRHRYPKGLVYLQDLFVDPDVRGGGVGRGLISAVYDAADAAGTPAVYWLTQEWNYKGRMLYDQVATKSPFIQYRR